MFSAQSPIRPVLTLQEHCISQMLLECSSFENDSEFYANRCIPTERRSRIAGIFSRRTPSRSSATRPPALGCFLEGSFGGLQITKLNTSQGRPRRLVSATRRPALGCEPRPGGSECCGNEVWSDSDSVFDFDRIRFLQRSARLSLPGSSMRLTGRNASCSTSSRPRLR